MLNINNIILKLNKNRTRVIVILIIISAIAFMYFYQRLFNPVKLTKEAYCEINFVQKGECPDVCEIIWSNCDDDLDNNSSASDCISCKPIRIPEAIEF